MRKGQAAARRDARRHHLQRFISASEKGKQPERALEVFEAMQPTVHVRRASSGRKPLDLANTAWAFATLSSQREHCCCSCFVSVSFGALIIFLNLVSKI